MRIVRTGYSSSKVSFEKDIIDIIFDAVSNISDTDKPEIEKQVESWLNSASFSNMIEKIVEATDGHINHAIEDIQQSIVDLALS